MRFHFTGTRSNLLFAKIAACKVGRRFERNARSFRQTAKIPRMLGTFSDLPCFVSDESRWRTEPARRCGKTSGRASYRDLVASIPAAERTRFLIIARREPTMQWIGETIESPTTGSLNAGLEQGSVRDANGATSFGYDLLHALQAMEGGDFSVRMAGYQDGLPGKIAETLNGISAANQRIAKQLERVGEEVGREGKTRQRVKFGLSNGAWGEMEDSINTLIDDLLWPTMAVTRAIAAVAKGDLLQTVALDIDGRPLKGEFLQSATIVNTMIKQLNVFTSEVTRVAREVGTGGKLGGQAQVREVTGVWMDLTESVNSMASNLTAQVRNIADVTIAVANGDLSKKITVDVRGEILQLKEAINTMVDQLRSFASEVTRVAREVGTDGKLGGQAIVPGVAGTWKDLTGNVNLLAANLTTHLRAIAEVATAVTKGDLTRSIQVDARGEVAELKDNINTMIDNLRLTTDHNTEQDWLKTNLARFTNLLQGQRDLSAVGRLLLSELTPLVNAQLGAVYRMETEEGVPYLKALAAYANDDGWPCRERIPLGVGLIGQCAIDKRRLLVTEMPTYIAPIGFSMFRAAPQNVIVLPVLFENQVKAIIELASVSAFTKLHMTFLEQLTASVGIVLNSIETTMQTEGLLKQSQQLAGELQTRQRELQQTNEQLELKAQQLAERNVEVERKNQEIEQARRALEEKATELALTSKYKSEFLANMSHELRTPLNSILILGQQLSENPDGNLTGKQVDFARTIHSAGTDLLNLISDILDLSKIESGTVTVEPEEILLSPLLEMVTRPFRHEAETRQLSFDIRIDQDVARSIVTDAKRLQQVLKNLLSNAFKFTSQGGVRLSVIAACNGWHPNHPVLKQAPGVIAFEVSDTGIGIPPEKQRIIFEAFQQADASTSRKYGGTGLGLAISRELSQLLGGEIQLRSMPGRGSIFTLYLPNRYVGPSSPACGRDGLLSFADQMAVHAAAMQDTPVKAIADDRRDIQPGDNVLLIIEDDPHYAQIMADVAHGEGFKVLVAMLGVEAIELGKRFQPTAVSLDIFLPDMLGWTVLSQLKLNPLTRHIPVHIITLDENRQHGLACGAFSFATKPVTTEEIRVVLNRIKECGEPRRKRLLVVEHNAAKQMSIRELLGHDDIEIVTAGTGAAALRSLRNEAVDCMVLDLGLPDMSGFEVLEQMRVDPALWDLPVVVFSGRELSAEEDARLNAMARSIVVKSVESPERLLDETSLFLHRVVTELPPEKQRMLERLNSSDENLIGRTVLLVDDDARNIFALSSVLERREMHVLTASTGKEAIEIIESTPDLAVVLVDIMMPEMDGYQTIERIRRNGRLRRLPIIALTAKAMKGDREKCLEAGASDYLAKPVNTEQLLSALRMWLHR
jgi:CheY-like chemotaxis protein/HAMP domain-containing protein